MLLPLARHALALAGEDVVHAAKARLELAGLFRPCRSFLAAHDGSLQRGRGCGFVFAHGPSDGRGSPVLSESLGFAGRSLASPMEFGPNGNSRYYAGSSMSHSCTKRCTSGCFAPKKRLCALMLQAGDARCAATFCAEGIPLD